MKEGIGSVHKQTGEILAYLTNWSNIFILRPSAIAVLTLTFSQYFLSGIMDGKLSSILTDFCIVYLACGPPEELVKITAIFAIRRFIVFLIKNHLFFVFEVMMININSISVSAANRLNIIFVICKVVTILTVIIFGLVRIAQGLFCFSGD